MTLPFCLRARARSAALACAAALLIALGVASCSDDALPRLGNAPDFSLTDQDGHPFGAQALRGKVWVIDFFSTATDGSHPGLTSGMGALQRHLVRYGGALQLVSVTVDPRDDTPQVLEAYAAKRHADLRNWHFLTGSPDAVGRIGKRGLKLALEAPSDRDDGADFNLDHARYIVLVDAQGTIRGYYPANDGAGTGVERLMKDATRLLEEGP